jgi:hypothetical protein
MSTFLDYLALFLMLLSATAIFYLFIYIHELPHKAAERRGHPHAEAIGVACWLSLFTLHALWPIVFIWALSYKRYPLVPPGVLPPGVIPEPSSNGELTHRLAVLEERLRKLEAAK